MANTKSFALVVLQLFCCLCVPHNTLALQPPTSKKNVNGSSHLGTSRNLATTASIATATTAAPSILLPKDRTISSSSSTETIALQKRTVSLPSTEPAIWKLALAGSVATLFSDVLMHPLDSIKTLQQTEEGIGLSMIAAANFIYHLGGPSAFMKGFLTWGVCDALGGALKFSTYEGLKRQILEHDLLPSLSSATTEKHDDDDLDEATDPSVWNAVLVVLAALSFVASSLIVIPGELLKQHLQMGHYPGCFDAVWSIVDTQGIMGLYNGYDGVLFRDVPYTALELSLYDMFKNTYLSRLQQEQEPPSDDDDNTVKELQTSEKIIIAGLTGGLAGLVTTPFDTIKTRAVIDFVGASFWDSAMLTIDNHGPEALFCGAAARVAWLVPVTALYLPTYDFIKSKIQEQHDAQTTTR